MERTCIVFGFLFCIAGLLMATGKVHPRLKAWQIMPQEEKDRIHIVPLCRNVGLMIGICGVIFLAYGAIAGFSSNCFCGMMAIWVVAGFVDVYRIEKSGKYIDPEPISKPSLQLAEKHSYRKPPKRNK